MIGSLLRVFDREISARFQPNEPEVGVHLISALVDIDDEGARVDSTFADKQPDWTYDEVDSGKTPVERFTDHREPRAGGDRSQRHRDPMTVTISQRADLLTSPLVGLGQNQPNCRRLDQRR